LIIGGWILAGLGFVLTLLSFVALIHHLWLLYHVPAMPLSQISYRQSTLSLAIKFILPFSLLGRSFSVVAYVQGLQTWVNGTHDCDSVRDCWLPGWVFMIINVYPGFLLNTLFILCSLFWGWLLDLAKARQRHFSLVLYEWGILSGFLWIIFIILFMLAAVLPGVMEIYLVITLTNFVIGIILLLSWCYHAVSLWQHFGKQNSIGGNFTKIIFLLTFAILALGLIRFIMVIIVALRPTQLTKYVTSFFLSFFLSFTYSLSLWVLLLSAVIIAAEIWTALFEFGPAAVILWVITRPRKSPEAVDIDDEVEASFGVPSAVNAINSASDDDRLEGLALFSG
jgi:hypothetical protein